MLRRRNRSNLMLCSLVFLTVLLSSNFVLGKTKWTCASKFPVTSIQGKYYQVFSEAVKELSGGDFTVEVFPSETLGTTQAILDQLQTGTINLYPEGTGYLERFYAPFAIFELPFIYDNPQHWLRFFNSPLVGEWKSKELRKFKIDALHLQVLDPYRAMASTKPVRTLQELKGLKLRMFPNKTVIKVWEHLGANVTVIEWTAVYESLRTGLIEAVTGGIGGIYDMSFYEPARNILQTYEYPQGVAWMTNFPAYDRLTKKEKDVLHAAFERAGKWAEINFGAETEKRIKKMVDDYKVKIYPLESTERIVWAERVSSFYKDLETSGTIPKGTFEYIQKLK